MHDRIEILRAKIDEVTRGTDGRRVFTAAIRKEAIELASKWKESGRHLTALADALDLHKTTLASWLEEPRARKRRRRVRAVKVERGEALTSERRLVAVLPSGVRLEGLELSDAIELARALG